MSGIRRPAYVSSSSSVHTSHPRARAPQPHPQSLLGSTKILRRIKVSTRHLSSPARRPLPPGRSTTHHGALAAGEAHVERAVDHAHLLRDAGEHRLARLAARCAGQARLGLARRVVREEPAALRLLSHARVPRRRVSQREQRLCLHVAIAEPTLGPVAVVARVDTTLDDRAGRAKGEIASPPRRRGAVVRRGRAAPR